MSHDLNPSQREALEAAAFRRLVSHLQARTDVQNIDLMILADFCRNCMSRWMTEEAEKAGLTFSRDDAREHVYGMPYGEWKQRHQKPATEEQLAALEARKG